MNEEIPTPITDAFARQWHTVEEMLAFARDLERQLAEARENLAITQREWVAAKAERVEALRERDEARELLAAVRSELADLQAMVAKSSLIEVDATICKPDGCGKPVISEDGKMLVHKDYLIREQQRSKDLAAHAATSRKLAAERALADKLADAVACLTAETSQGYDHIQSAFNAWKQSRNQNTDTK